MFFGSLFILAYLFFMTQAGEILKINLVQIGWALITSIFLFGYVFTWYRGLSSVPVTIATSILLLGSPVTTILTILSGTKISGQMLYPSLLTILGISLIIYSHEKNRKKFEGA